MKKIYWLEVWIFCKMHHRISLFSALHSLHFHTLYLWNKDSDRQFFFDTSNSLCDCSKIFKKTIYWKIFKQTSKHAWLVTSKNIVLYLKAIPECMSYRLCPHQAFLLGPLLQKQICHWVFVQSLHFQKILSPWHDTNDKWNNPLEKKRRHLMKVPVSF